MSFTAKQVKAILSNYGVSLDNLDAAAEEICGRHKADLDSIKEERDELQGKLDAITQSKTSPTDSEEYKALQKKFDDEKAAHDKLKTEVATKETNGKKSEALKAMLKAAGYSEKGVEKIAKYGGYLDGIELDDNGSIKDSETLSKTIGNEWGEYIETKTATGAQTANPPTGYGGGTNSKSTGRAKLLSQQYQENNYGVAKTATTPNKEE